MEGYPELMVSPTEVSGCQTSGVPRGWAAKSAADTAHQGQIGPLARHCALGPSLKVLSLQERVPHPDPGAGARKGANTFGFWGRRLKGYTYRELSSNKDTVLTERRG